VLHDPFLAERTKSRDPNRSRVVKNMRAQSSSQSKVEGRREERRRKHPPADRVIHERREERHDRTQDRTHERTHGGPERGHESRHFHHQQFQQITLNNKTTSSSSAVTAPTGTGNLPRGQKSKSSSSKHSFQQSSSSSQQAGQSNERGIDVGGTGQSAIRETSQSQSNHSSTPVDNRIDFV